MRRCMAVIVSVALLAAFPVQGFADSAEGVASVDASDAVDVVREASDLSEVVDGALEYPDAVALESD